VAKRIVARITPASADREGVGTRRRVADFLRFLTIWQHAAPGRGSMDRRRPTVIAQLQGSRPPVGSWEESILPSRVTGFAHHLRRRARADRANSDGPTRDCDRPARRAPRERDAVAVQPDRTGQPQRSPLVACSRTRRRHPRPTDARRARRDSRPSRTRRCTLLRRSVRRDRQTAR